MVNLVHVVVNLKVLLVTGYFRALCFFINCSRIPLVFVVWFLIIGAAVFVQGPSRSVLIRMGMLFDNELLLTVYPFPRDDRTYARVEELHVQ